ncbi:terpenoid synthase [Macrolepiota fuliginosa MF-IS2]|uniref:Terpene synthase n=1 Tax=Macrolepiota fuliginosa MF-IS2 TaxID=1400762 RepID=A0A9P5X565_9AGAR|nr:terpenoid synthase [Macrolepiota fuliginosa MF-IS2]
MEHQVAFSLPAMLSQWPWVRLLSEHYDEARAESASWIESFRPFDDVGMNALRRCDGRDSCQYIAVIRLGSDLMNLLFVVDEYTDIEGGAGAERICEIVKDAFHNPSKPRPEGEVCVGKIARDFWLRAKSLVTPGDPCLKHFLDVWDAYLDAVVQEAHDRDKTRYRTLHDYLPLRRDSGAVYPALALAEFGLGLPEEVWSHPALASLREKSVDLVSIHNDIYSFAREMSRGLTVHNSVDIVMHERNLPLQAAMNWLGDYCEGIANDFLRELSNVPSWSKEIDEGVASYIHTLGQWVQGAHDWSFEANRYYDSTGPEIKESRLVTVLLSHTRGYVETLHDRG